MNKWYMICQKCSDRIVSTHVHDMKWCECEAVAIDGGNEYLRMAGEREDFKVYDGKTNKEI